MKSERLGRAVEQIQDFSANTRYRINLKKREFNVRAKENMLLESDINYPGDFDEYVKELFNEGEEESYPVVFGSHKAHPGAFAPLRVGLRVRELIRDRIELRGSLLLVAGNIKDGQSKTISDNFESVRPVLNKISATTQGVLRWKDMRRMKREELEERLDEQDHGLRTGIANKLIPVSLPEGSVESGRKKEGGKPGEINGMIPLQKNSIRYVTNFIKEAGFDPVLFFVGNTGENKLYDPILDVVPRETKLKGAVRIFPGIKHLIKSPYEAVADYPTRLRDIIDALNEIGMMSEANLERYCGERIAQLLPLNERGVYADPTLLELTPQIKRRDTTSLFIKP